MGPAETPAQCLCPVGRASGDGKRVQERDAHAVDHVDRSLTSSSISNEATFSREKRKLIPAAEFKQSGFSPLSTISTSVFRRSTPTTFYDGGDAQQCINACRQGFLQSGLSSLSSPASSGTPSFANTCSLLSNSPTAQQELWQLYWCDSAFCGVWIDAEGGKGQDPNVDLIINKCQNIGYSSIYDPGPPPASYYCSSLLASGPSANPCRNLAAVATETVVVSATSPTSTMGAGTTLVTQHLSQHLTTAPAPESTTSLVTGGNVVSAAAATGSPSAGSSNENGKNTTAAGTTSGPSAGVKGAIVAIIIVAVLLIAGMVFFYIRRRRNNMLGQAYQHRGGGDREGRSGPSRHRPSHANGSSGSIGLTARLRHQGQMLFYPGHGRGDNEVPTPLISPANSCNSVRGVSSGTGAPSQSASPKRVGANLLSSLRRAGTSSDERAPSQTSNQSRSILPSFFSRRVRDRSVSPPLTSLSPPPSPTQLSARGRHGMDGDRDGDGVHGMAGKNGNRVSAANSGSSYYGYYGYNGHFVPYYFPSSPICAPTTNKLEPRREKTPTIRPTKRQEQQKLEQQKQQQQRHGYYNFQTSQASDGSPVPPLPPLPVSIFSPQAARFGMETASHRGPRSSYGSYSTVTNASSTVIPTSNLYGNAVTTDTMEPMTPLASISPLPSLPVLPGPPASTSSNHAKPASPARPKRPHETPLEIPDLVMPDPPPSLFHAKNSSNASDRSFSMPGRTCSTASSMRRVVATGGPSLPSRAAANDNRPRPPPPNRALPSPPPAACLPSGRPSSTEEHADRESIESLELPPLLMRDDDDDDYDESGDMYSAWNASSRSSSRKYHNHAGNKPATTIASFSSTMSTSSMLSSSTTETASTAATVTSAPSASASTPTAASPQPQRPFYHGAPSTTSSCPAVEQQEHSSTRRSSVRQSVSTASTVGR